MQRYTGGRRAVVIKLGDPDIADAITSGMTSPRGTSEAVRRVAMMRHTPQEWATMVARAQYDYGQDKPVKPLTGAILGVIGAIVLAVDGWYRYFSAWNRRA